MNTKGSKWIDWLLKDRIGLDEHKRIEWIGWILNDRIGLDESKGYDLIGWILKDGIWLDEYWRMESDWILYKLDLEEL